MFFWLQCAFMYLFTGRMKKEIRRPNMREDWGISLQYSVAGNRIVKMKLNTYMLVLTRKS